MEAYIISIDQSTQGTKALLFDAKGRIIGREDRAHRQIVNDRGWISHDPLEIYNNTILVVKALVENTNIDKSKIKGAGISNQRETTVAWDRKSGEPVADAIVWQCARAASICERYESAGALEMIRQKTGIPLSPYFPAAKIAWILENSKGARASAEALSLCHGTIDSWLLYKLTGGKSYQTDYSNASRTQLFNIFELKWDEEICRLFGIDPANLAKVCDSNSHFGDTDFEGILDKKIPIHGVMGDSHGALYGQGCLKPGMIKATYGTGSSIMMNIGEQPLLSKHGLVTSLAWRMNGSVNYVLEGNLNYTGAVISWLKDDLELIHSPDETQALAQAAADDDLLYLVPAFSGLGAPYWDSKARASLVGMSRTTGKAEVVKAGLECIAYQITDIIKAMSKDVGIPVTQLRADGGPAKNQFLMQFQSDIANLIVAVSDAEELSGIGAAYAAGIALGVWDERIFARIARGAYRPQMAQGQRNKKYAGWKEAVRSVLSHSFKHFCVLEDRT